MTEHGRLIDGDELYTEMSKQKAFGVLTAKSALRTVSNAPTIEPGRKKDDFEKGLHDMFDHIWDCEIDHPMFQDTIGELMEAVIQLYNNIIEPERKPR